MNAVRNVRREERVALRHPAQVSWTGPEGHPIYANGHTVDISAVGIRFELPMEPPARCGMIFRVTALSLNGRGTVRYVRRAGIKYLVGVDFSGGLRWKPPADAAAVIG